MSSDDKASISRIFLSALLLFATFMWSSSRATVKEQRIKIEELEARIKANAEVKRDVPSQH